VGGSGIHWAICKSALRSRQITTPAPHHSVFYRLDALPAAQPTASKLMSLQQTNIISMVGMFLPLGGKNGSLHRKPVPAKVWFLLVKSEN